MPPYNNVSANASPLPVNLEMATFLIKSPESRAPRNWLPRVYTGHTGLRTDNISGACLGGVALKASYHDIKAAERRKGVLLFAS